MNKEMEKRTEPFLHGTDGGAYDNILKITAQ